MITDTRRPLRIAFCGPSGTGKTTLATYLSEALGLPLNPVGSRSVAAAMGFASPYDVDAVGARAAFQRRLLSEKTRWEAAYEAFVSDRTVLDNLAYTIMHDCRSVEVATLQLVAQATRRYTHIVKCPMSTFFRPGSDPMRVFDQTYHELYETVLEGLLARHAVQGVYVMQQTSLEERKREVTEAVGAVLTGRQL